MAIQQVAGPGHIFISFGTQFPGRSGGGGIPSVPTPLYLGTAERSPEIDLNPEYDPTFNDLGGNKIPFDLSYQGTHAFISAGINRWNENVYRLMAARAGDQSSSRIRGQDDEGDVGTLTMLEGYGLAVWVQFPYHQFEPYLSAGMPAGYRFVASVLISPNRLAPLGTTHRKIQMTWHAIRWFDPQTGKHICYDHNMSGLPAID